MNDVLAVGRFKRVGELNAEIKQKIDRKRLFTYTLLKRLPFEQLHHDEETSVSLGDLIDRAYVGMIQGRRGTGLALKAFQCARILFQVPRKKLESYVATEV